MFVLLRQVLNWEPESICPCDLCHEGTFRFFGFYGDAPMKKIISKILYYIFLCLPIFHWPVCRIARWLRPSSALAILGQLKYGPDRQSAFRAYADRVNSFPNQLLSEVGMAVVFHPELWLQLHSLTPFSQRVIFYEIFYLASIGNMRRALHFYLLQNFPRGVEGIRERNKFLAELHTTLSDRGCDLLRLGVVSSCIADSVVIADKVVYPIEEPHDTDIWEPGQNGDTQ